MGKISRDTKPSSKLEIFKRDLSEDTALTLKQRQMLVALCATKGIVTQASVLTGLSRQVHHDAMQTNENYKSYYARINEILLDWVEGKLFEIIEDKNFNAVKFFLTSKGKKRGYQDDNGVTINNNNTVIEIIYNEEPNEETETYEIG